jgi:LAO/AO transport system kinase
VFDDLIQLFPHAGRAHIIGFTGSPGVGKSTLVDRIVGRFRADDKTVGVLAVDPTSPFSGGAILGDRIRMQKHFLDQGVFIRSMATRGAFGGLTRSTADAIVVLDAMGKDVIVVETVGVGQDEVEIAHSAHTTVLVTIPGMGDDIQAIKAGLMEIGDLFVVNKADRDGVAKTVRELKNMLEMSLEKHEKDGWFPPVLPVTAIADEGIDELYQAIADHREFLQQDGGDILRQREITRVKNQLTELLKENLMHVAVEHLGGMEAFHDTAEDIIDHRQDPYRVCRDLVQGLLGGNRS